MTDEQTDKNAKGPPEDRGIVNPDVGDGHWVRRIERAEPHRCEPPSKDSGFGYELARAEPGELWRCRCGKLWECYRRLPRANPRSGMVEVGGVRRCEWRPAGLWLQTRYWPAWEVLSPAIWAMLALTAVGVAAMVALAVLGVFHP